MRKVNHSLKRQKIYSVGFGFVFIIILSSCSSMKTVTVDTDYIAKSGFIMAKPIIADITVEKRKIEGRAVIKNSLYGTETASQAAKNLAVMDAVKKGNADIIVQPMYEIESDGETTTAIVSGFAGKYKEFRDVTAADTTAFNLRLKVDNSSIIASTAVPTELSVTKKKNKGGIILAAVLLPLLILIGVAASGA